MNFQTIVEKVLCQDSCNILTCTNLPFTAYYKTKLNLCKSLNGLYIKENLLFVMTPRLEPQRQVRETREETKASYFQGIQERKKTNSNNFLE